MNLVEFKAGQKVTFNTNLQNGTKSGDTATVISPETVEDGAITVKLDKSGEVFQTLCSYLIESLKKESKYDEAAELLKNKGVNIIGLSAKQIWNEAVKRGLIKGDLLEIINIIQNKH